MTNALPKSDNSITTNVLPDWEQRSYRYGFVTSVEMSKANKGLSEETIRFISAKKDEPSWLLDWRLEAFEMWKKAIPPTWSSVWHVPINYQEMCYYAAPKSMDDAKKGPQSLDDVDPAILRTYDKLGIPLQEQKRLAGVAVDAVFDSVSVGTTFQKELGKAGVLFCSFSEAVHKYPDLVRKYLGTVVSQGDNFYATLNAAVFSDGSFVYIPEGVRCPMELSTYFRINEADTGQFERTLIIADKGASLSYLEGCTAPQRDKNQLHAAVVELVALDESSIKYSTVQNWYPGDAQGRGGVYNFVTKRGECRGRKSFISWTQVEVGAAITWKYPSCILRGDDSRGDFYSVTLSGGKQQVDSGTKMIHLGARTRSRVISKGIATGSSRTAYRGLVRFHKKAKGARNYTNCDSMIIGDNATAKTFPFIESHQPSAIVEHEATTSRLSDAQMAYCMQRGLNEEEAAGLIVNGFCREVIQKLPMEFMVEATRLLELRLEGSIG